MFDDRVYTFLTLYKQMNYHTAAQMRNMTQPGVTQHIQYLEKQYGVKFFRYEGRSLYRTPEAERFKRCLDRAMAEERALRQDFSRKAGVHLRIGATKTIGEFVLPPVVDQFLQDAGHSLDFVIDNTHVLLQMLEDGALDFAMVEGVFDKARYDYRLYQKEKFTGICTKNHKFAGKRVPIQAIFDQTLLIREKGSGTRRLLEQALSSRGFSLDSFSRTVSLGNFSVLMDLLIRENAITFAYQPIACQRKALTTFEVEGMEWEGEFNFVYCSRAIGEEKIRLFFGQTNTPDLYFSEAGIHTHQDQCAGDTARAKKG